MEKQQPQPQPQPQQKQQKQQQNIDYCTQVAKNKLLTATYVIVMSVFFSILFNMIFLSSLCLPRFGLKLFTPFLKAIAKWSSTENMALLTTYH